ncbi:1321_t:CDS:1, partial [Acaulospora colombiana]
AVQIKSETLRTPTGNSSSGTVTQTTATTAPASNSGAQGWSSKLSEAGFIALAVTFGMVAFL